MCLGKRAHLYIYKIIYLKSHAYIRYIYLSICVYIFKCLYIDRYTQILKFLSSPSSTLVILFVFWDIVFEFSVTMLR